MISQGIKDFYWATVGSVTILNLYFQKTIAKWRFSDKNPFFLNLGSGAMYVSGFMNVDGNLFRKKDLWLDIRYGLPFLDCSVDGIYICHVLEHFHFHAASRILRDCCRVLKQGRGVRVVLPSLEKAIRNYINKDKQWFPSWPDNFQSLGGRFNNYLLCRNQHRLMFDFSFAEELLRESGFCDCREQYWRKSVVFLPEILPLIEPEERHEFIEKSLIVEAFKK